MFQVALARGMRVFPRLSATVNGGFWFPERNALALAEKVEFLLDKYEIGLQLSRRGRDYMEKHYDLELLNDRLVELYERLLADQNFSTPDRGHRSNS